MSDKSYADAVRFEILIRGILESIDISVASLEANTTYRDSYHEGYEKGLLDAFKGAKTYIDQSYKKGVDY